MKFRDPSDSTDSGGRSSTRSVIPADLPEWLAEVLPALLEETELLRKNGAHQAATARDRLVQRLLDAHETWLDQELSTEDVAAMMEQSTETVRRKVRSGVIPDTRTCKKGRMSVRRRDALRLVPGKQSGYDPVTDAQDIAQLRSSR